MSFADAAAHAIARLRSEGHTVSEAQAARLSTPEGALRVLASAEQRARSAYDAFADAAQHGSLRSSDLASYNLMQKRVYLTQKTLYQIVRNVPGVTPPVQPTNITIVPASSSLGTLGSPAVALLGGIPVAYWAAAVLAVVLTAVIAALALVAVGAAIGWFVYQAYLAEVSAEQNEQHAKALRDLVVDCTRAGGSPLDCLQAAQQALPQPPPPGSPSDPWIASLMVAAPVVLGVALLAIGAYVAVGVFGKGNGGGGSPVVVFGGGSSPTSASSSTSAQSPSNPWAPILVGTGAIIGLSALWWRARPATAAGALGSVNLLQGRGQFRGGRRHEPVEVDFVRFTGSRGSRYDLEVGR